jgi:6-phosphogluconolactonase (cycloisomerase 2 family)
LSFSTTSLLVPPLHRDRLNVVYTCTEDIEENGQILAYEVHHDGSLTEMCRIDAGGTSTCYLTIDRDHRHLIAVNYWDSTLVVIPLSRETGEFAGPIQNVYDPKAGKKMIAAAKKHGGVNHSNNDSSTIAMRQVDPHSHALVLDPFEGCVAYVPDLGKDLVREIHYDSRKGALGREFSVLPSGMSTGMPDGPRYIDFHPRFNVAYVVNELSSTIAVFSVDRDLLGEISRAEKLGLPLDDFSGRSTLRLIQSIKTVPSAFPVTMNTCGRICVHQSGRFVIVSNRGHESIAVFRVKQSCGGGKGGAVRGKLAQVGIFHTRGETPRHFMFDHSGQFLIVANQDSDTIAVFSFNLTSGEIKFTGHEVSCYLSDRVRVCGCFIASRPPPLKLVFHLHRLRSTASRVRTSSAAVQWSTGTPTTTSKPPARGKGTPSSRSYRITMTRRTNEAFPLPSSSI